LKKHVWTCSSLYAVGRRDEILSNARRLFLNLIISPSESHYYRDAIETTLNRIYCISTNPSSLNNVFQLFPNVNQHRSADIEKRLFQISYEDLAIGTLPKALTECIQELHKAANPALYPSRENVTRIKDQVYWICSIIQKDSAEYWKERCRITIEWEESEGITKDKKRKNTWDR
jgi:hypothetical protein